MDLCEDIWRSILLKLKVNDIINISLVNKSLHTLTSEKILWSCKFEEQNLQIINNEEINNIQQYISEYKKVSYASYKTTCLTNMMIQSATGISAIWLEKDFTIDDILLLNCNIFDNAKNIIKNSRNYVNLTIGLEGEQSINFHIHNKENHRLVFYVTEQHEVIFIHSLLNKIFYHFPSIQITDNGDRPIVVSTSYDYICYEDFDSDTINIICKRKEYWDKCYSKYESLYF
jgi:hypothetical protein